MVKKHLKKYWTVYLQVGLMIGGIILGSPDSALASNLDATGNRLYGKILGIGKWVIIIKGGIEIIQHITSGDTQSAKKIFIAYLIMYAALFALPWGMNEVEGIFKGMS
jgi:hypothetical protein